MFFAILMSKALSENGDPGKSRQAKQSKGTGMKIHCPYCGESITPDVSQCPSCSTPYDLETLLRMRSLLRETLPMGSVSIGNSFPL